MDGGVDDSYIIIVHDWEEESGIKFYNFDDDIKPEETNDFVTECKKILKNVKEKPKVILSEKKAEEELLNVKDEPLDYDEYLNSEQKYLISKDEYINERMYFNVSNDTLNFTDDLVDGNRKVKGKNDDAHKSKKGLKNPSTKREQYLIIQNNEFVHANINDENVYVDQEPSVETSQLSEMKEETKDLVNMYLTLLEEQEKAPPPPLPHQPYNMIDKTYRCKYCDKETEKESLAIKHYRFSHGEKYNKCVACNGSFRRRDRMIFHETYCEAENAHLMRLAREILNQRKQQEKTKIPYKVKQRIKIPCNECGILISKANMSAHIARHYAPEKRKRRYFCAECPKFYLTARSLDAHMNVHAGIKPYKCLECGKTYSNKNTLLSHKWTHFENRFQCDHCKRTYRKRNVLATHIKEVHDGQIERLLCNSCGQTIMKKNWLIHINKCGKSKKGHKNAELPKYNCVDCDRLFINIKRLNSHMKKIHGKEVFTREKFLELLPQMNISGLEFDMVKTDDILSAQAEDTFENNEEVLEVLN